MKKNLIMKLFKYSLIALISISLFSCEKDDDTTGPTNNALIYLDANGVTIKAGASAVIGDTASINGILYTVVDTTTLRNRIDSSLDVTNICVSRITDMSFMFYDATSFNQDISSWDVSNVTNMRSMFDVDVLFGRSVFNQDISSWDVSNVIECSSFSTYADDWTLPKPNFTNCNPN